MSDRPYKIEYTVNLTIEKIMIWESISMGFHSISISLIDRASSSGATPVLIFPNTFYHQWCVWLIEKHKCTWLIYDCDKRCMRVE